MATTLAHWTFDDLPAQEYNGSGLAILQNQFRAGYGNTLVSGAYPTTGYYNATTAANDVGAVDLGADSGTNAAQSVAKAYHLSSGADYYSRNSSTFVGQGFGANSWGFGGGNTQPGENYFQFKTSTTGESEIHLRFDQLRNDVGLSDNWSVWYSTTLSESTFGGTGLTQHTSQDSGGSGQFTKLTDYTLGAAGADDTAYVSYSFNFSGVSALNNKTAVWFRLVNDGGSDSSSHRSLVDNVKITAGAELSEIAPGIYFDIATGSTAGAAVNGKVHLVEPGSGDNPTFQIVGGTGQSLFSMNTVVDSYGVRRGQIVVAAGQTLSAAAVYTLDVTASDGTTTTSPVTMTINVVAQTLQGPLYTKYINKAANAATYTNNTTGNNQIATWLTALQPDGSFTDIDYSFDGDHYVDAIERLATMSEAYRTVGSPYHNSSSLKLEIYTGIEKWIASINSIPNLQNTLTHAWEREDVIAGIGLMLRDAMNADILGGGALGTRALALYDSMVLESGKLFHFEEYNENFFGANRAYRYEGMWKRIALMADYNQPSIDNNLVYPDFVPVGTWADIASLVETNFVRPSIPELNGQTNDSALAHHAGSAAQNLTMTYGRDWAIRTSRAFDDLMDTPWEADTWQYDRIAEFWLDGYQWMLYAGQGDYTANGRANGVKNTLNNLNASARGWVNDFLTVMEPGDLSAEDEARLILMRDQLQNPALGTMTGNKSFWNHDFMVHRDDDYYVSVKMNSTRSTGPESGNDSGKKNFHMSDGFTQIRRTGNEYNNSLVAWNYRAIPGTTAEQRTSSLPLVDWGGNGQEGDNTYAGGVSNGVWGASAFQYDKENSYATVNANKGYFFTNDEFVALGSNVRRVSTGNSQEIWTTLNQTLWASDVVYNVGGGVQTIVASAGTGTDAQLNFTNLNSPVWFHQDNVGYVVMPTGSPVNVKLWAEQRTGDWNDINSAYANGDNASYDIFQLSINHGTNPTAGNYQYIVVPDIASGAMQAYVDNLPITVLANTNTTQAVRDNALGLTQVAFYAAGSLEIAPGLTVGVNAPAMLMVHEQNGQLEISVSDPNHSPTLGAMNVTVSRQLAGGNVVWNEQTGISTITFALPTGVMQAGQSVVQTFSEVTGLPADFDDDADVDGNDFLVWQRGLGTPAATHADGDADGDDDVDQDDLAEWRDGFGSVESLVAAASAPSQSAMQALDAAAASDSSGTASETTLAQSEYASLAGFASLMDSEPTQQREEEAAIASDEIAIDSELPEAPSRYFDTLPDSESLREKEASLDEGVVTQGEDVTLESDLAIEELYGLT